MGFIKRRVRRVVRRRLRNPARAAVKRAATHWCPECQKRVEPFHLCAPKSDFRQRLRQADRRAGTERRRQRKRETAARRKAAKGKSAPRAPRERRSHQYQACTDEGCQRPLCVAFKAGMAACPLPHQ
jgi:hypothetical protein